MATYSKSTPLELEDECWMLYVTSLKVYYAVFRVSKQNKRFACYTQEKW